MSFPRYPKYKDSGVQWLGKVPEHWPVALSKRFITVKSGDMISSEDETEQGFPLIGGNGLRAYTSKWNTSGDTLVIGRVGALCGCVHHITEKFWASEHAFRVIEKQSLSRRFFFHLLSAMDLNKFAIKTAQPLLNTEIVETQWISVPPLHEQTAIGKFLDHETAKIDVLVEQQRRLIDLLGEKRQAVISHVVTKGLDPDAPMKPSDVEWLGEIPAHWTVTPIRRVILEPLSNGIFKKKDEFGGGVLLVNVFDIYRTDFKINFKTLERVNCETHEILKYEVSPGDLFFVRSSLKQEGIAAVAMADELSEPVVFECHLIRARPNSQLLHSRFGSYVLNSAIYRSTMVSKAKVTTMTTVDQDAILSTPLPIPPLPEQTKIANFLDRETGKIDALTAVAERAIELLQERRISLISAAVTGKIDVCGLVPVKAVAA